MSTLHGGMNASTVMSGQVVCPGTQLAYRAKTRTILPQNDCTQLAVKVGVYGMHSLLLILFIMSVVAFHVQVANCVQKTAWDTSSPLFCDELTLCQIMCIVKDTISSQMNSQEAAAHHTPGGGWREATQPPRPHLPGTSLHAQSPLRLVSDRQPRPGRAARGTRPIWALPACRKSCSVSSTQTTSRIQSHWHQGRVQIGPGHSVSAWALLLLRVTMHKAAEATTVPWIEYLSNQEEEVWMEREWVLVKPSVATLAIPPSTHRAPHLPNPQGSTTEASPCHRACLNICHQLPQPRPMDRSPLTLITMSSHGQRWQRWWCWQLDQRLSYPTHQPHQVLPQLATSVGTSRLEPVLQIPVVPLTNMYLTKEQYLPETGRDCTFNTPVSFRWVHVHHSIIVDFYIFVLLWMLSRFSLFS